MKLYVPLISGRYREATADELREALEGPVRDAIHRLTECLPEDAHEKPLAELISMAETEVRAEFEARELLEQQLTEAKRESRALQEALSAALVREQMEATAYQGARVDRLRISEELQKAWYKLGRTVYLGNLARSRTTEEQDELNALVKEGYAIWSTER